MFDERINSFVVPSWGVLHPLLPGVGGEWGAPGHKSLPHVVPIAEIYHAARQKAIEDHEVDKLFNPDYFDYQI